MGYSRRAKSCPHWRKCSPYVVSLREGKYVERYWEVAKPKQLPLDRACKSNEGVLRSRSRTARKCDRRMSAGFYGIMLALQLCTKVSIFGFTGGSEHYYPHSRKGADPKPWHARHHWSYERACITALQRTK